MLSGYRKILASFERRNDIGYSCIPITRPTWVRTILNFIVFILFVTEKGTKRMVTWNRLYFFGASQLSVSW